MSAVANLAIYDLHVLKCGNCGVRYAMDADYYAQRLEDGVNWTCPNGCVRYFPQRENEIAALKRERDNLAKRLEWAQQDAERQRERAAAEERSARSIRGHATRLRKRIAEGKCPCCSRVFADMASHIAEKHPRYVPKDEGAK